MIHRSLLLLALALVLVACSKPAEKSAQPTPAVEESATPSPAVVQPKASAAAPSSGVSFFNAREFDGMWVGGQPTPAELRAAAAAGVKTVINLRTPSESGVAEEVALAEELKLNYVSIPVAGVAGLTTEAAKKLDEAIAEAGGNVILHCGSGNRVGALLAVRARRIQGKSAEEALAIGRASGLTGLEGAVLDRIK